MTQLYKNLYQFTVYIPPMDFTIHQYLLAGDPAILFAAGTVRQAQAILPQIKDILGEKKLSYIFVSHMESDECGGVSVFHDQYPDVRIICSPLCARELPGFGYDGCLLPVESTQPLQDGDLDLQFFDYPSEVHLQDGLVCFERNSGIFYSADLMLRLGNGQGQVRKASWQQEIASIDGQRVPNEEKLEKVKNDLAQISPGFVAVGHGFCLECEA